MKDVDRNPAIPALAALIFAIHRTFVDLGKGDEFLAHYRQRIKDLDSASAAEPRDQQNQMPL